FPYYAQFVKALTRSERVCINVNDETMKSFAMDCLVNAGVELNKVEWFFHPTNDAWCRDHGPAFLINPKAEIKKIIVDWNYNAWGNKYPPYDLDDDIPTLIAKRLGIPVYYPGIIMEGGSVDFNGRGTVMTSESCLLNKNRNPHLTRRGVEEYLMDYYGMDQVLWVKDGIIGDDTDGHIDDTVRFINEDTVITVMEENIKDGNHAITREIQQDLKKMRLTNGKQLNIIEIPMPDEIVYEDQRLPASYANFYIANSVVIVPTYRSKKDIKVMDTIGACFPDREVIGIDSTEIIWGLGSFHCLSQQEPSV
ncbi:MAG: agmatine/peptidylarginine deiminase, partial [Chitinophagales bacterium]